MYDTVSEGMWRSNRRAVEASIKDAIRNRNYEFLKNVIKPDLLALIDRIEAVGPNYAVWAYEVETDEHRPSYLSTDANYTDRREAEKKALGYNEILFKLGELDKHYYVKEVA